MSKQRHEQAAHRRYSANTAFMLNVSPLNLAGVSSMKLLVCFSSRAHSCANNSKATAAVATLAASRGQTHRVRGPLDGHGSTRGRGGRGSRSLGRRRCRAGRGGGGGGGSRRCRRIAAAELSRTRGVNTCRHTEEPTMQDGSPFFSGAPATQQPPTVRRMPGHASPLCSPLQVR